MSKDRKVVEKRFKYGEVFVSVVGDELQIFQFAHTENERIEMTLSEVRSFQEMLPRLIAKMEANIAKEEKETED